MPDGQVVTQELLPGSVRQRGLSLVDLTDRHGHRPRTDIPAARAARRHAFFGSLMIDAAVAMREACPGTLV
ncbi:hypothetical protein [Leekyejoonella antrihumi]|uniref:Uncharacterized protein n=1 Tax=Leekyejoonella antrihumi TaxID=1660198 RepID=A0A563E1D6_9MICO|nr:hypothetical protein [Leekyejoonella antrihumi]TWP36021.1 hypothetical protein FGL98_11235 [Leekyejoonella antrihumi]